MTEQEVIALMASGQKIKWSCVRTTKEVTLVNINGEEFTRTIPWTELRAEGLRLRINQA